METPLVDDSFKFDLIMKFRPPDWINTPPHFADLEAIPSRVELAPGDSYTI